MPRAHLTTHIVADQPSPRSGIVYTEKCLGDLVMMTNEAPIFFGRLDPSSGFTLSEVDKLEVKLVGFDLIQDRLYAIVEAQTEQIIDQLMGSDYVIRLLSKLPDDYDKTQPVDSMIVKALLMEKESA